MLPSSSIARYCTLLKIKIIIDYLLVSFLLPPEYGEASFHIEKNWHNQPKMNFSLITLLDHIHFCNWQVTCGFIEIFCHFPVSFFLSFLSAELKKKLIFKVSEGFTDISIKIAIVQKRSDQRSERPQADILTLCQSASLSTPLGSGGPSWTRQHSD